MQKFKNLAYLLLFSLVLISCGEYQKVLNKGRRCDPFAPCVLQHEKCEQITVVFVSNCLSIIQSGLSHLLLVVVVSLTIE